MPPTRPGRDHARARKARARVLARSRICWLCGLDGADTVDHVVPVSKGGDEFDEANMRSAHRACNLRRGNRDPSFGAPPSTGPRTRPLPGRRTIDPPHLYPRSRDW